MAIKFSDIKGTAKKGLENLYKYREGDNLVRLVGDVMPRYVYWLKGTDDKDVPFECLAFDRGQEKFTNIETDYVREKFPSMKCQWSYVSQVINVSEKKLEVIYWKKKLFQQILALTEDLGDPSDIETGWDISFKRQKTGALKFDVQYTLNQLRCKKRPLTQEERDLLVNLKPIDELFPRPTPESQLALLNRISIDSDQSAETSKPLEVTDDLPM